MEQNEISKQTKDYSHSLKVNDAIQHPLKIVNCKDDELIKVLTNCFIFVGLPDESMPKGLRRTFLIEYVRENYKYYGLEEVRTAFTMLVNGELTNDPKEKPHHFNIFSPEYFGSVMKLYKIHRDKAQQDIAWKKKVAEMENEKQYIPDTVLKEQRRVEFDKVVIMPIFDKYKQFGILDLGIVQPILIFNSLTGANKIIEFSDSDMNAINENAKENLKERAEQFKKMKATSYKEHKNKMAAISELIDLDSASNEIVKESHLICIKLCFDKMIEQNIRL